MRRDLVILISTCEKYQRLARLTRDLIDDQWDDHPPIYFCGTPGGTEQNSFPLESPPADWMAVLRDACRRLLAQGQELCYLVLDDHPPFGRCHAAQLNTALPALMDQLDAFSISLLGWGQGRSRRGTLLPQANGRLEQLPEDYLWRFSLHPGLWKVPLLVQLLDALIASVPTDDHTAWKFERLSGSVDSPIRKFPSFKIDGESMAARPWVRGRTLLYRAGRAAADLTRVLRRLVRPSADQSRLPLAGAYHFYAGPYPLFWSGIMQKGKLNREAISFLKWHGQRKLLQRIHAAVP